MRYICDGASVVGVLGRHGTLPDMRLACHHVKIHFLSFVQGIQTSYDPRGWLYCVLHIGCVVNYITEHIVHSMFGIEQ